jgi:large subunit ribosomal protein L15
MRLDDLKPAAGSNKKRKRVGRGDGSGHGKTSCRGHKGQGSRSGGNTKPGFEGGQMPLQRRLPKRGFHNRFANDFAIINLGRIQRALDAGKLKGKDTVTETDLREAGLVSHARNGIRLLAQGEFKTKLSFEVAGASRSAIEAVEKLGGSVKTSFKKTIHMNKKGEPGKRVQRRKAAAEKRSKASSG